jgi:GNAT superfamily N-acetyltransferase
MISIRTANPTDHAKILEAYAAWGYGGGLSPSDTVFLAFQDSELIGLVRMVPESGALVLRGMYMSPTYQRHGIGTQLLHAAMAWLGEQECYCLPHIHLVGFYSQVGFRVYTLGATTIRIASTCGESVCVTRYCTRTHLINPFGRSVAEP